MTRARLILIHGRAQQGKSEAQLIEEWMEPLRATLGRKATCLDGVEIKAPFYGDRLIEMLDSLGAAKPDDVQLRGPGQDVADERYRLFLGEFLEAVRNQEGLSEDRLILEAGVDVVERGAQNWPWVLAIVRALNKIPGLDGTTIEHVLRDVWIYLDRQTVRKAIDAIVAPAFDTDLPVVCVAHSLGTIVAYSVLAGRSVGHVSQLITLGSPLGLDVCRRTFRPIKWPKVVGRWFNARDKRDVVALHPLDPVHFGIDPPIENYEDVWNRTPNAHGISGYVTNARVAGEVHRALAGVSCGGAGGIHPMAPVVPG